MHRRQLLASAAAAVLLPHAGRAEDPPFDGQTVRAMARALATTPYKPPDTNVPEPFDKLSYDQYGQIRFDPNQALWRTGALPFQAQFYHRGFLFRERVDLFEVADGRARPIAYRPEQFSFPADIHPPKDAAALGFAGVKLLAPINRPDTFDEVASFLGASYFRAVGRNLTYGISARGLALNTGDPGGEEFPAFRAIWLERPTAGTNSVVVSALIDSPSATAAMRIAIRPGDDTVMDVELSVNPRVDLAQPGIATGTSMFQFDASNHAGQDDWRPAVHDSDGLMMLTGRGEALWRQLANPRTLQISSFTDSGPRGFGLMQRKRSLLDFEDLAVRYDRRPSLWVEPIGDWGEGVVQLVEIPTRDEIHDNIVAFWRPKNPLRANAEHTFTYRLHWCAEPPVATDLGRFVSCRGGLAQPAGRVFVLEATGAKLRAIPPETPLTGRVSTDKGTISGVLVTPNPEMGGWRISFDLQPGDTRIAELRATIMQGDTPVTETWVYRWTA